MGKQWYFIGMPHPMKVAGLVAGVVLSAVTMAAAQQGRPRETPADAIIRLYATASTENAEWGIGEVAAGRRQVLTEEAARAAVSGMMRDPESTRFRGITINPETGAVCGYFNARNAYGAYVGYEPFVYFHSRNRSEPVARAGSPPAGHIGPPSLPFLMRAQCLASDPPTKP